MRNARGFSLLEVMVALGILGLALTAIVQINGGSMASHDYSKRVTIATLLARSKMVELESYFTKEGFTSEFDQTMSGNFSEEGWNDFHWEAEIIVPDLDAANATALVQQMIEGFAGDAEKKQREAQGGGPTMDVGMLAQAQMGGMLEAQLTKLITTLEESVREIRLRVYWGEGEEGDSVDVTTHFVIMGGRGVAPTDDGATPEPGGGATP